MKNGFRWCEKVLHGGDVTQNHEKSIQRLSLNGKVQSVFRSKLICFLHNVFLRKFSRRIENYIILCINISSRFKIVENIFASNNFFVNIQFQFFYLLGSRD